MYAQPPAYPSAPHAAPPYAPGAQPVMYCPQPAPAAAPAAQQQTTVVMAGGGGGGGQNNNDDVIGSPTFRDTSVRCKCTNCHKTVFSTATTEVGCFTWLVSFLLCLCGGAPCFLCLIPFCADRCKDVRHKCPNCQTTLGVFKRL